MAGAPVAAPAWQRLGAPRRMRCRRARPVTRAVTDAESFRKITSHPESVSGSDGLRYFGYGANVGASALKARGVLPSASVVGRADGWRLSFIHKGGYATIDRVGETSTWGSVHRISETELAVVRGWETGYEMVELDVYVRGDGYDGTESSNSETNQGTKVRCVAFVTKPSARLTKPVAPFDVYAEKVWSGGVEAGLPDAHLEFLRAAVDTSIPREKRGPEYWDVPTIWQRMGRVFRGE